jgi:hypothetical protein
LLQCNVSASAPAPPCDSGDLSCDNMHMMTGIFECGCHAFAAGVAFRGHGELLTLRWCSAYAEALHCS